MHHGTLWLCMQRVTHAKTALDLLSMRHNTNMYMGFNNLDTCERLYKTQYRLERRLGFVDKQPDNLTTTYGDLTWLKLVKH